MQNIDHTQNRLPVAPLKIAALESCRELAEKVNEHLIHLRSANPERTEERAKSLHYRGYDADSYLLDINCPRFGTGEGKGIINESVRGSDLYVMVDVTNYSLTYKVDGDLNHMSPDDHFQDLKRIIAAGGAAAHRISVIMPFLYEGRQHRRTKRESLDCAYMLTELENMGISNFITFDAHDPRVQNATPFTGFDNFMPTYQFIKTCFKNIPNLQIDKDHLMIISPDEGAMDRAIYVANILGVDIGMFYKRRDYSKVINGRNPIVAHEFLGASVKDKDVMIMDDMISSGESMMDTARSLKERGCKRVIICATFGLFTNGLDSFREKYEAGIIDYVCTTNLNYRRPELLNEPWYLEADMSGYLAYIIHSLNCDASSEDREASTQKIQDFMKNLQNDDYEYYGSVIE
ncbi:ribose-phosphate pyrophosphokinase [Fusobacterium naviforme]|uniref:ribose-phosphate diphosphokinase n=1 Tax=Moryella indoligenes TaxID=371674 RepID=A0AAE4ALM6_9FIRM|nr:ribose-phosphate pyrophosphokinase [Moryella indoligenes]KAB0577952.1 ribose-phosphate pyrophosphokinase [Fusobacterium naviforme]MDQ0152336.1 ribose-phosphate pyrophosphokinase [Moryella indoligenes]PSL10749.1 ribose-phosphate pyrophosphokinase [Fusobacterium naviforme]STO27299.1 Ribose-phosphate pyrophosphokinase [Fusobacterium naviforme]